MNSKCYPRYAGFFSVKLVCSSDTSNLDKECVIICKRRNKVGEHTSMGRNFKVSGKKKLNIKQLARSVSQSLHPPM